MAQKTRTHRVGYAFIAVAVVDFIIAIFLRTLPDVVPEAVLASGIGGVATLLYGLFLRLAIRGDLVELDRTTRTVSILPGGLRTKRVAVYSWGDVESVTIEKSDKPVFRSPGTGGWGYRPVLVMRGAERIPFARWSDDSAELEPCVAAAREVGKWETPALATA